MPHSDKCNENNKKNIQLAFISSQSLAPPADLVNTWTNQLKKKKKARQKFSRAESLDYRHFFFSSVVLSSFENQDISQTILNSLPLPLPSAHHLSLPACNMPLLTRTCTNVHKDNLLSPLLCHPWQELHILTSKWAFFVEAVTESSLVGLVRERKETEKQIERGGDIDTENE